MGCGCGQRAVALKSAVIRVAQGQGHAAVTRVAVAGQTALRDMTRLAAHTRLKMARR